MFATSALRVPDLARDLVQLDLGEVVLLAEVIDVGADAVDLP